MEVEDLIRKDKKKYAYIKFKDSSTTLDKILYCQRSPTNKSGLGYKQTVEETKFGKWTPSWKYDMDSSLRRKSKFIDQEHVQHLVNKKRYI